jgi:hypothetical protein
MRRLAESRELNHRGIIRVFVAGHSRARHTQFDDSRQCDPRSDSLGCKSQTLPNRRPSVTETLGNDSVLVSNAGSPSDTVRSGLIGNVHGFQTFEYAQLPTNAQNLAGFAAIPEALVLATRVPPPPEGRSERPVQLTRGRARN